MLEKFRPHSITTRIKTKQFLASKYAYWFPTHSITTRIKTLCRMGELAQKRSRLIPLQQGLRPNTRAESCKYLISSRLIPLQQGLRQMSSHCTKEKKQFPTHSITTRIKTNKRYKPAAIHTFPTHSITTRIKTSWRFAM